MLTIPRFKPCYSVVTTKPDNVFLLSERETVCLSDRFLYLVASLIDGDRTSDEIVETIQFNALESNALESNTLESNTLESNTLENKASISDLNPATLFQEVLDVSIKAQAALFRLEAEGYIEEKVECLPPHVQVMCAQLGVSSTQAAQRLQERAIAVHSIDSIERGECVAVLEALGIRVVDESTREAIDLTIVLTHDYLHPALEEWNQKALRSRIPWLLVKPVGTMIWIGPLFAPDQHTACWHCLARRLHDNRPVAGFLQRTQSDAVIPTTPQPFISSTVQTALGMAATEVFKWIVQGENDRVTNRLITYDTLTFQKQNHRVVRRPQCPSCGEMPPGLAQKPLPVVLGHRPKNFTADGGHRVCSPEETLRKYGHHLSPLTGVVRELAKVPGHPLNHTYVARHHFVTMFDDLDNLRKNLSGRSAGKGRTDSQARASGFCEAIERYSGVFQGDELREKGSFQGMGDRAIHPNDCMNFSQHQYQTREEWNAQCHGWFQKVPEPFDEEREIDWTPVWSLTDQTFKYLPTAYCYYGYPQSHAPDCWADSNGCAAGNTIEEAILQGLMEVVERDSVALWWYNRLQKPQVDLDSFDDPYFHQLQQYYQQLGRTLWVLDITSDLNIPTFAAISSRIDHPVEDIILGYGTHLDPKLALSRALTELNQILPSVLAAKEDGTTQYPLNADPLAIKWWTTATLADHSYLLPSPDMPPKKYTDYPQRVSNDLLDDVSFCQKTLEKRGMDLLVLDQTRADVGLRVAKVIVPGIRHMWKRFGTGRLYEIPAQLGWLNKPLTEEQLNPFPMWM
ncbi:MAG: TOMM precursor leader peptide-binding protein [Cyanothece sp. SIO2G6]|nr:TOMM precursor leader peptide-binding protein [Cyanothece sp. SIO2G6]